MNHKDDNITIEVEKRIEDFFGEGEASQNLTEDNAELEGFKLQELKAITLSIDWEIDDEIMTRFLDQVNRLKNEYRDDNIILMFLRLLGSVGKYIKTNKANAHPDSIKLLNSVYINLENVSLSKDMPEAERKKLLLGQIKRFKKLKKDIGLRKVRMAETGEVNLPEEQPVEEHLTGNAAFVHGTPIEETTEASQPSPVNAMAPQEAFAYAIEEMKQVIKSEFKALRAELMLWRDGK